MSQFDLENNEVIALVNENHRRSCICPTVGIVVPMEEAKQMAVRSARAARNPEITANMVVSVFFLFAIVTIGVVVLA